MINTKYIFIGLPFLLMIFYYLGYKYGLQKKKEEFNLNKDNFSFFIVHIIFVLTDLYEIQKDKNIQKLFLRKLLGYRPNEVLEMLKFEYLDFKKHLPSSGILSRNNIELYEKSKFILNNFDDLMGKSIQKRNLNNNNIKL